EGLAPDVRTGGVRLSAGERQLVGLARVALADPEVIVLDEATSNLDPATEALVEQALASVAAGRTMITIAHRLSTAERADRVAVLDRGRLVEIASHDELLRQNAHYARLWASWQAGVGEGPAPPDEDGRRGRAAPPPAGEAERHDPEHEQLVRRRAPDRPDDVVVGVLSRIQVQVETDGGAADRERRVVAEHDRGDAHRGEHRRPCGALERDHGQQRAR